MEISYWKSRWHQDNTGWQMESVYPLLPDLWKRQGLKSQTTVLVPLCGNSPDLHWLVEAGHRVIGVDVSEKALKHAMEYHSTEFTEDTSHGFRIFRSSKMDLWQGDFLTLPTHKLPDIDLIYDKAALIALPPEMRPDYAQQIRRLTNPQTQQLVQTFEYEQHEMPGPPFSVHENEIANYYGNHFSIEVVHEQSKLDAFPKFQQRGLSSYFTEKVYHLKPIHQH